MSSELLALLHSGQVISKFAATSRYYSIEVAVLTQPDGSEVAYLRRRFLPDAGKMTTIGTKTVQQGDRLDLIAHQVIGDPEQFWRICDANPSLRPTELEEVGVPLTIANPEVS